MLLNFLSSFFKAFSLVSNLSLSNGLLLLPPGVLAPSLLIGELISCAAAAVFFFPVTVVSYFYTGFFGMAVRMSARPFPLNLRFRFLMAARAI